MAKIDRMAMETMTRGAEIEHPPVDLLTDS
jgi:hypothetical protein